MAFTRRFASLKTRPFGRRRWRRSLFRRRFRVGRRTRGAARFVKRVVRRMAETKWQYIDFSATYTSTASDLVAIPLFSNLAIGTSKHERIGQLVRTARLTFKILFSISLNTALPFRTQMRMTLVRFPGGQFSPTGAPVATDIYEDVGTANGLFNSMVHNETVQVYRDVNWFMTNDFAAHGLPMSKQFKVSIPWIHNFSWGDASNITKSEKNIPWLILSMPSGSATNSISVNIRGRMTYKDI